MTLFEDLSPLDLLSLSRALLSEEFAAAELTPFDWLGIVEMLEGSLVDKCQDLTPREWSVCVLALARSHASAVDSGILDDREVLVRRLNLGAVLTRGVPVSREFEILNPDALIAELFRKLPMTIDEARRMSADWRSLEISQIRVLRSVKNLVTPAVQLARVAPGTAWLPMLRLWADILPDLP
ncbi:hypothetical protein GCM10022243_17450 [Saccharothrix violaceirubra]|uniref:Uncharacterized protein n=1 Tax=Saccharothrix violaceirubra TaxID=413306 RepID=A0A7W7SYY3_9PSEU|nr:hypothetical protein [Saccharothrix violaceirubra]MBB4963488.1 hypothetical protein [Saccharothrix violaceirubra]